MKFKWDKRYLYWGITAFSVVALSILFFMIVNRFDVLAGAVAFIIGLLMPFILGFIFAYLLNPVVEFFEKKCFLPLFQKRKKKKPTHAPRALAITVSLVLALSVITGLLFMVVPQLATSIMSVFTGLPGYAQQFSDWALELVKSNAALEQWLTEFFANINQTISGWVTDFLPELTKLLGNITEGVKTTVGVVTNIFIGLIVSIYAMFSKEKFIAQAKKFTYSLLPVKATNLLMRVVRQADITFGGFIKGKLIDSSIIGVLCFIGMSVMQMPFALLISVLIGVSNIIPFFGPFLGAIPSAILILIVDPWKCLWFIIFIVVLQQFDGNILGPRILGGSTGLSAFWVTFAIVVFGGLFGFTGMIIGVPTFALIYSILSELIENRLNRRRLPAVTGAYTDLDYIDEDNGEPVYREDLDDVKEANFDKKKGRRRILKPVDNMADTKVYHPEAKKRNGKPDAKIYVPRQKKPPVVVEEEPPREEPSREDGKP